MKTKITKDILLDELVNRYPESIEVLLKYGLHCIGCAVSAGETLEEGAQAHGMSEKEVAAMVKEINLIIQKNDKS